MKDKVVSSADVQSEIADIKSRIQSERDVMADLSAQRAKVALGAVRGDEYSKGRVAELDARELEAASTLKILDAALPDLEAALSEARAREFAALDASRCDAINAEREKLFDDAAQVDEAIDLLHLKLNARQKRVDYLITLVRERANGAQEGSNATHANAIVDEGYSRATPIIRGAIILGIGAPHLDPPLVQGTPGPRAPIVDVDRRRFVKAE